MSALRPWPKLPNRGARKRRSTAMRKPHANGPVVEKDPITPKLVDPYTLHPDVYSMDVRGHMGSDVIVYDAKGKPVERILAATRQRVAYTYVAPAPVPALLIRDLAPSRRKLRANYKSGDVAVIAARVPDHSPRIVGNMGAQPLRQVNASLRKLVRRMNPGV